MIPRFEPKLMIRTACPEDIPQLLSLASAYRDFEGMGSIPTDATDAALRRLLADPRLGAAWIAVGDGDAVGYLLGVYVFSLEHAGLTAEIDELFVLADHRGRGIGGRLLATAESEFHRVGCTNVSLQVGRGNDAGRAFYERRGYTGRSGFDLIEKSLTS